MVGSGGGGGGGGGSGEPRQLMEEAYLSNLAYHTLYSGALDALEAKNPGGVAQLRSSLEKADSAAPGFLLALIRALLGKAALRLDLEEAFLRLQGQAPPDSFFLPHPEQPFQDLSNRAIALRRILARIPDEIADRRSFLEIIKEIASSIKKLLDATNNIYHFVPLNAQGSVERRKKEFVSRSKKFSNTLKEYFKGEEAAAVYVSANALIFHISLIIRTVRDKAPVN